MVSIVRFLFFVFFCHISSSKLLLIEIVSKYVSLEDEINEVGVKNMILSSAAYGSPPLFLRKNANRPNF